MPEPGEFATAAAILLAATLAQGFLGFGFGIAAMTLLTLTGDLLHAAGLVNLTGIAVSGCWVIRLRRQVLWRPALRILPALAVGVVLGVSALGSLDRALMIRTLGVTTIAISIWNLRAPSLQTGEAPLWDGVAGLLGGLLGGAFNTGGPPIVAHLYRRPESPDAIKATVQLVFLGIGLLRLPAALAQRMIPSAIWIEAALLIPFALVGLFAGLWAGRKVSSAQFRRVSWLALGALGGSLALSP